LLNLSLELFGVLVEEVFGARSMKGTFFELLDGAEMMDILPVGPVRRKSHFNRMIRWRRLLLRPPQLVGRGAVKSFNRGAARKQQT
jgi:hypothetical protein